MRDPFSSISPLQSGEIGDDFTYYFATSEQVPSSVGLGVLINPDNSVKSSGGFIIQVMTGCPDEVLNKLEERLKTLKPVSQMVDENYSPLQMIEEIVGKDYEILEDNIPLEYKCDCSKERFALKMEACGEEELEKMINVDHKAEVVCHFCMKHYEFSESDLVTILNNLKRKKQGH